MEGSVKEYLEQVVELCGDDMTCSLCCKLFIKPHTFRACNHTFCWDCVIPTLEGPGITQSQCPTCRMPAWKKDLCKNCTYEKVIEALQAASRLLLLDPSPLGSADGCEELGGTEEDLTQSEETGDDSNGGEEEAINKLMDSQLPSCYEDLPCVSKTTNEATVGVSPGPIVGVSPGPIVGVSPGPIAMDVDPEVLPPLNTPYAQLQHIIAQYIPAALLSSQWTTSKCPPRHSLSLGSQRANAASCLDKPFPLSEEEEAALLARTLLLPPPDEAEAACLREDLKLLDGWLEAAHMTVQQESMVQLALPEAPGLNLSSPAIDPVDPGPPSHLNPSANKHKHGSGLATVVTASPSAVGTASPSAVGTTPPFCRDNTLTNDVKNQLPESVIPHAAEVDGVISSSLRLSPAAAEGHGIDSGEARGPHAFIRVADAEVGPLAGASCYDISELQGYREKPQAVSEAPDAPAYLEHVPDYQHDFQEAAKVDKMPLSRGSWPVLTAEIPSGVGLATSSCQERHPGHAFHRAPDRQSGEARWAEEMPMPITEAANVNDLRSPQPLSSPTRILLPQDIFAGVTEKQDSGCGAGSRGGDKELYDVQQNTCRISSCNKVAAEMMILGTMLKDADKLRLKSLVKRLGRARSLREVDEYTTHVITSVDENGYAGQRTKSYLMALLQGAWLLSPAWLVACEAQGEWVPEEPFLVKGDPHAWNAPLKCRLPRETIAAASLVPNAAALEGHQAGLVQGWEVSRAEQPVVSNNAVSGVLPAGRSLFSGMTFYLDEEPVATDSAMWKTMGVVREILVFGGGRVIRECGPDSTSGERATGRGSDGPSSPSQTDGRGGAISDRIRIGAAFAAPTSTTVISNAKLDMSGVEALRERWGSTPVLYSWVFDSVSHFKPLPRITYEVSGESQEEQ